MENIDVHDLPEPVARAIEVLIDIFRKQHQRMVGGRLKNAPQGDLPVLPGTVIGALHRREIYDNV